MLAAINNSTEFLCSEILGEKVQKGKSIGKNFYGASIPLICDKKESHYYLFLKKDTLKEFAKSFLGEETLCEDGLNDMCKEVANLIVGKAKALLQDANPKTKYQLGTPEYLGKVSPPFPIKLDDFTIYKLKNRTFVLGIKKAS